MTSRKLMRFKNNHINKTTFALSCAKVVYLISCSSDSNSGDEKNSARLISKPSHKILIVEI